MNLLLTGKPGVGKTTLIRKVCESLPQVRKSGFYTAEIRTRGERKGFKIITTNGLEDVLAHVDFKSKYCVGRYGVSLKPLEELALPRISPSTTPADLIIIDEIGKMECFSEKFRSAVLQALDAPVNVLATIAKARNDFIEMIVARDDVRIMEVTLENRNSLSGAIVALLDLK